MEKIVRRMVMFDRLGLLNVSSIHTGIDKLINFRSEKTHVSKLFDILDKRAKEYENRISVH